MTAKVKVAVLISGAGSNMAALIDAAARRDTAFDVALVISNAPDAAGLNLARALGVDALAIDHRPHGADREAHERQIQAALDQHEIEVVALAGYMRVLSGWLVARWSGRMLNIHPSLLPKYAGLQTHARAIAAGDAEAGCTVHLVTDGVDEGPILGQARVPILADDTAATLAERVRVAEHGLYPLMLDRHCRGLRPD